jgi:hypothetical protein
MVASSTDKDICISKSLIICVVLLSLYRLDRQSPTENDSLEAYGRGVPMVLAFEQYVAEYREHPSIFYAETILRPHEPARHLQI